MGLWLLAIGFPLFFLTAPTAAAASYALDPSVATASAVAPAAMIQKDLGKGWTAHPTAGYFTGSTLVDGEGGGASVSGFGGTGEAEYSFSEHLGINFSALGFRGSGHFTPGSGEAGAAGSCDVNGWMVGAELVLDPFSGTGFRLPFFVGLNYQHLSSTTPSSAIFNSMSLSSPGYTLGYSIRFNVGFLRLEPFTVMIAPMKEGNVSCAAGVSGSACGAFPVRLLPIVGVNIVFLPWNLSFYLNAANFLVDSGVSFYSFGPQISF